MEGGFLLCTKKWCKRPASLWQAQAANDEREMTHFQNVLNFQVPTLDFFSKRMLQNQQSEVSTCFATFIAAIYSKTAKQDVKKTNTFWWNQQINQFNLWLLSFFYKPLGLQERSPWGLGAAHQKQHQVSRNSKWTPQKNLRKRPKPPNFTFNITFWWYFDDIFMF